MHDVLFNIYRSPKATLFFHTLITSILVAITIQLGTLNQIYWLDWSSFLESEETQIYYTSL